MTNAFGLPTCGNGRVAIIFSFALRLAVMAFCFFVNRALSASVAMRHVLFSKIRSSPEVVV